MLHPIGSGPARHDETRRETIEVRQRRPIHFIGHERGVLDRLPGRDALDEVGGLVGNARIGAVEDDFDRLLFKAGLVQKVFEPGAFPARAAHGAVAPLHPGNVGMERPRRLPEHRFTATSSAAGNRLRSSSVNSAWPLAPSPPTTIFQVLTSTSAMFERW